MRAGGKGGFRGHYGVPALIGDRRITPANDRVAAIELSGRVESLRLVEGDWLRCRSGVAPLLNSPNGGMDSQLLFGERFRVLEVRSGWAFGQMERDNYVGFVGNEHLGPDNQPTHKVNSLWTQIYAKPEVRSLPTVSIPLGSRLEVKEQTACGAFLQLKDGGFVPAAHVGPATDKLFDHVGFAELYLGTPYLWGGNSPAGIDCSGLAQMALIAAGEMCPRDSDMQQAGIGEWVPNLKQPHRGDLVFWRGHVGIMLDAETMLHATGHHMAVVREPLAEVIARIETQGVAQFQGLKRLRWSGCVR